MRDNLGGNRRHRNLSSRANALAVMAKAFASRALAENSSIVANAALAAAAAPACAEKAINVGGMVKASSALAYHV